MVDDMTSYTKLWYHSQNYDITVSLGHTSQGYITTVILVISQCYIILQAMISYPRLWYHLTQGSRCKLFPCILYTWMCQYQAVQGRTKPYTAWYWHIQVYRMQGKCLVQLCTAWYWDEYEIIDFRMYWFIPAHTATYCYILVYIKNDWNVAAHTISNLHILISI